MNDEWIKRPYDAKTDEDGVVYLWLKSYAHARHNIARGANRDRSDAERQYWNEHAPIVECLLRSAETWVLCDPKRVYASADGPPVILAFACLTPAVATLPATVHYVSVKRHYARGGFGPDMVRDLLGTQLRAITGFSHELVEMIPKKRDTLPALGIAVPDAWYDDRHWLERKFLGGARAA